jgi:hypothetical protein
MSAHTVHNFDSDADTTPIRPGQLSSNGHWVFGSIYAALALVGFGFGVWAGAAKPKPAEIADAKKEKDAGEKSTTKPPVTPPTTSPVTPPNPNPPVPPVADPKPKDPDPKPKDPDPKPKDPDPKPKDPPPKPKDPPAKAPDVKAVSFKEVEPILRAYCVDCHGAPGKRPGGGIDLRTLAAIKKGDKSGDPVLVPGNPEKSTIYESITAGRMPDMGKTPPPADKLLVLRNWILSGAKERRRPIRVRRRLELTRGAEAG